MPADFSGLDAVDTVGREEFPFLDADEHLLLAHVLGFEEENLDVLRAWERLRREAKEEGRDAPERLPDAYLFREHFERMTKGWVLFSPRTEEQRAAGQDKGTAIPFTVEQRNKFFGRYGAYVVAAILRRLGGILPAIPAEEVNPATGDHPTPSASVSGTPSAAPTPTVSPTLSTIS